MKAPGTPGSNDPPGDAGDLDRAAGQHRCRRWDGAPRAAAGWKHPASE
ncbi:MAG: hypothetical protein WCJ66_17450 [Verrucomicrobiota bacterium]